MFTELQNPDSEHTRKSALVSYMLLLLEMTIKPLLHMCIMFKVCLKHVKYIQLKMTEMFTVLLYTQLSQKLEHVGNNAAI